MLPSWTDGLINTDELGPSLKANTTGVPAVGFAGLSEGHGISQTEGQAREERFHNLMQSRFETVLSERIHFFSKDKESETTSTPRPHVSLWLRTPLQLKEKGGKKAEGEQRETLEPLAFPCMHVVFTAETV
ncbi:hypothetical protein EYF80_047431 [Liparis tanakae]|uniref:Uncharacterized protein n=1 Tax=Liparis tanakae TaxID=230148 RepID=A0A4Z2FMY6_9TELE|nr:hypothetical protein EYF80_047431 [Liparis tanakae]